MSVVVFKKSNKNRVRSPWCCRWMELVEGEKKRREKHFRSEVLAEAWAANVAREQLGDRELVSDLEWMEFSHARELCRSADVDLLTALRAGFEALNLRVGGEKIDVPTIRWAVEAYLYEGEQRNLRPATVQSNRQMLESFVVGREDRLVSSVDAAEMLGFILAKYTLDTSRRSLRTRLAGWWRFCAGKGWLPVLDATALSWTATISDKGRPGVFSVEEAAGLLAAVPDKLKAAVAIGLFAGVRPEELRRMEWSFVDATGDWFGIDLKRRKIELSGAWTKIRRPRTLHELPDNLWAWLERYKGEGLLVPVTTRNWYNNLTKARAKAGIRKTGSDLMRHSFGSYGRHRGLDWVIDVLGHTGDMSVFAEHYNNNAVGPDEASAYFSILP